MVTRRCTQREFLLRPSKVLNHAFRFMLAHGAARAGVQLHAACVMSNHFHVMATDPAGDLSKFMHWLDGNLARFSNAYHGRWENFFAPGSYSAPKLLDAESVLEKLVYVLANPVAAGLVRNGARWPGVRLSPRRIGKPERVERPRFFFREDGPVPPFAILEIAKPPAFADVSDEDFLERVDAAVARREAEIQERFSEEGRVFLGEKAVLAQSIHTRPSSREPRMQRNPHVACREKWKRIAALEARKQFVEAYREALQEFCRRLRNCTGDAMKVVFPNGTYRMRVRYGVRCLE